eukprot:5110888-Pleurochrysis_carterae.AAC.2
MAAAPSATLFEDEPISAMAAEWLDASPFDFRRAKNKSSCAGIRRIPMHRPRSAHHGMQRSVCGHAVSDSANNNLLQAASAKGRRVRAMQQSTRLIK